MVTYSDKESEPKTRTATTINLHLQRGGRCAGNQSVVDINPSIQHGSKLVEGEGVQVEVIAFTLRGCAAFWAQVRDCDCYGCAF